MRAVSSATCTSDDPVSPSAVAYCLTSSSLSGMAALLNVVSWVHGPGGWTLRRWLLRLREAVRPGPRCRGRQGSPANGGLPSDLLVSPCPAGAVQGRSAPRWPHLDGGHTTGFRARRVAVT